MPIEHVSTMQMIEGKAPGIDQMGRIKNLAALMPIVEKVASYTCKEEESGTVFIANHATVAVNFTLPALGSDNHTKGEYFYFFNVGAAGMVLTSDPADKLVVDNDVAADTLTWSTASHIIGGCVLAVSDGAKWLTFRMGYESTAVAAS